MDYYLLFIEFHCDITVILTLNNIGICVGGKYEIGLIGFLFF